MRNGFTRYKMEHGLAVSVAFDLFAFLMSPNRDQRGWGWGWQRYIQKNSGEQSAFTAAIRL